MVTKSKQKTAPVSTVVPPSVELTPSKKIWLEIGGLKLDMFGLPDQFVSKYYEPVDLDDKKLYLRALKTATAALPALEAVIGAKYNVELAERFVIVSAKG